MRRLKSRGKRYLKAGGWVCTHAECFEDALMEDKKRFKKQFEGSTPDNSDGSFTAHLDDDLPWAEIEDLVCFFCGE